MSTENKPNGDYSMFNGRRTADQYVKGYLKGIACIAGLTLLIILPISGWAVREIINTKNDVSVIQATRFTKVQSDAMAEKINENTRNFAVISNQLNTLSSDMSEMKDLLKRAIPH